MKSLISAFYALLIAIPAVAKDKPKIEIQVADTQTSERQISYNVPGRSAQSTTNCNSSATAIGLGGMATANGTTNCVTTTTAGTPTRTVTRSIRQAQVYATMPDGRHITLWCQQGFRQCDILGAGRYSAEVDGSSVWIYVHELSGKEHKVKYRYVGGW